MYFWKKKVKPARSEDLQGWSMSVVQMDDSLLMVRLLQDAKSNHKHLSYQVGVATPLNDPNELGFHENQEGEQLGAIEDTLISAFQQDGKCCFVCSNCGNSAKEWVFYTSDPEYVKAEFAKIHEATVSHSLQLIIQSDPNWSIYDAFVALTKEE
ncbi:MAG: DUF695 domain-containing protein [Spartobacteria bacterium]|nr:DUF695 domain-containing protein [Spartobacteria bacterium]